MPEDSIQDITSVLTLLGGEPVHGDGDFKPLAPELPPAMPDWSPVRSFGGYQQRAQAGTSKYAFARLCGCASSCNVHGHAHAGRLGSEQFAGLRRTLLLGRARLRLLGVLSMARDMTHDARTTNGLVGLARRLLAPAPVRWLALLCLTAAYLQGGFNKAVDFQAAVGEMNHFGLAPAAPVAVATIVLELGASVLILTGFYRWLGALTLAGFTLMATFLANRFWEMAIPEPLLCRQFLL